MNKMNANGVAALGGVMAILMLLQCAEAMTVHVVGGDLGWRVPPRNFTYKAWASTQKFAVGDILTFNLENRKPLQVFEVVEENYKSCISDPDYNIGNVEFVHFYESSNVTLNQTGEHFYICPKHCDLGLKLAINVSSSPSPSPSPSPLASSALASFALIFFFYSKFIATEF